MSVFLRKQKLKKGIYLSFVESTYSSSLQNVSQKVIKKIGYVEDLKAIYSDPIAFFTEEAKKLSAVSQQKYQEDKIERIPRQQTVKNVGYFPIARLYKQFNFQDEFEFLSNKHKFQFDLNSLFKFLVYSQIIMPGSKLSAFENKSLFFDSFDFTENQMYDGINFIGKNIDYIKQHILFELQRIYKPVVSHTFFDCTNIYFEIDKENDFQKRGPEKNHRHDPIIGLGLLMDANGVPLSYTTFPGNQGEHSELHKNGAQMKRNLNITGKTIYVADKGLNSGDNMQEAIDNNDGYVMGQKVLNCDEDTFKWITNEQGYTYIIDEEDNEITYKIKSTIDDFPVKVTSKLNGQKVFVHMKQKRVIFYSKNYADKARLERERILAKAYDLIKNPSQYRKKTVGDAASYIKEIKFDKNGEIINTNLEINKEYLEKQEALEGYYMIVTSEIDLPGQEIIKIYRGLWEIEETFSIMKGVLKVRPIFAKTKEGIESHILVCFTSLLFLRLLQKKYLKINGYTPEQIKQIELANKRKRKHKIEIKRPGEISVRRIVKFMREYEAQLINDTYFIGFYNPDIHLFENKYNLKLDKHRLSLNDIYKIFDYCIYNTR